jgi:hypothetical protein
MSNPDPNASSASDSVSTISSIMGAMSSVKEKWDASGGNDVISNVSARIPQGTKDYLSQAQQDFLNRENLKGVTVYFGIGEERPFYIEKVPSLLMERIRLNLSLFYLNYMLLTAVLFVLTLLISPSAIIGIGLLGLAWMYVIKSTQSGSMPIYGFSISAKQASLFMAVISVVVLMYLLSHVFWWTLFSSGFLISLHLLLRDASMHKDEEDKIDMTGDLDLDTSEDAAFLNPASDQV